MISTYLHSLPTAFSDRAHDLQKELQHNNDKVEVAREVDVTATPVAEGEASHHNHHKKKKKRAPSEGGDDSVSEVSAGIEHMFDQQEFADMKLTDIEDGIEAAAGVVDDDGERGERGAGSRRGSVARSESGSKMAGNADSKSVDGTKSVSAPVIGASQRGLEKDIEWMPHCHIAVLAAIFELNGADKNLFLPPNNLDKVFLQLTVPLVEEDATLALNTTVIDQIGKIGFTRFLNFLNAHVVRLCRRRRLERCVMFLSLYRTLRNCCNIACLTLLRTLLQFNLLPLFIPLRSA